MTEDKCDAQRQRYWTVQRYDIGTLAYDAEGIVYRWIVWYSDLPRVTDDVLCAYEYPDDE
jgi:hypothetical protein